MESFVLWSAVTQLVKWSVRGFISLALSFSLFFSLSLTPFSSMEQILAIPIIYAHKIVNSCQSANHACFQPNDLANEQQVGQR